MNLAGIALRLGVFLLAILAATWISAAIRDAMDLMVMPRNETAVHRTILLATLVFIVLLAIPFVPGAEIGLTMLAVFGAAIAPLVYCATVVALVLAYTIGRVLPPEIVVRGLRGLGLTRAAEAIAEVAALPRADRLARLMDGGSPRLLRLATRYRYLALMAAINLPGNVLIGGGGGIALMAGMSGLFSPLPFLLAVAVAVVPVPLTVLLFGA